jgi:hypothetical protein
MLNACKVTTLVQPLTTAGLAKLNEFSSFVPDDLAHVLRVCGLGSYNLEVWLSDPEDFTITDVSASDFSTDAELESVSPSQLLLLATTCSGGKIYGSQAPNGVNVWVTFEYDPIEYCGVSFASALAWFLRDLTSAGFQSDSLFFHSRADSLLGARSKTPADKMADLESRLNDYRPNYVFNSLVAKCFWYSEMEALIILCEYDQVDVAGALFTISFNRSRVHRVPFWEFVNAQLNS